MAYVEFLRLRTSLAWHVAILAAVAILIISLSPGSHVEINGVTKPVTNIPVPLGMLAPIGMFFAAIFASSQGASLNRENSTRDISWTKPIPRSVLALQYLALDIATVLIAFVITMLTVVIVIYAAHDVPVIDPHFGTLMILGMGVAVMWFSLIQVLTFWLPPSGRSIAGIMWPVALLALALAHVGGTLATIMQAIDIINPLAYMSGVSFSDHGAAQDAVTTLAPALRPVAVWLFSALFCAITVTLWPKKEA